MRSWPNCCRAILAVAVLIAACGGDDDPTLTAPTTPSTAASSAPDSTAVTSPTTSSTVPAIVLEVQGGQVVGGARKIEVGLGEQVRLVVRSDVADEVHVHGYDEKAEVGPGSDAILDFPADIPGVFEIELEDLGLKLGDLEVKP